MNLLKLEFEKLNCKLNSVLRSSNQISNLFECDARTEQKEKIFDFFERNKADGKIKDIFFFKSGKIISV